MESVPAQAWQYGVLGVVAVVFGYAIMHLFRALRADQHEMRSEVAARERERAEWMVEREGLKAEYERKHRELAEGFAESLRDEREANRAHEDAVRREFSDLMEKIATESSRSAEVTATILSKLYDRFANPERSRKR